MIPPLAIEISFLTSQKKNDQFINPNFKIEKKIVPERNENYTCAGKIDSDSDYVVLTTKPMMVQRSTRHFCWVYLRYFCLLGPNPNSDRMIYIRVLSRYVNKFI